MGDVVDAIFEYLDLVGFLNGACRPNTDFTLAGSTDFVVVYFNLKAHRFHGITHGATQVVQ